MNQNMLKQFVTKYFDCNNIKYSLDDNNIYHVHFTDKLANKLGKKREFSFNREIADDYGVEYGSLSNSMIKYLLRDSINEGQIIRAKLDSPILPKDKLQIPNDVIIKSQSKSKESAICFLFKIASSNDISDNTPEFLKYVIVSEKDGYVFSDELADEFHNIMLSNVKFHFNADKANKSHTIAYEHLTKYLEFKYSEYEGANKKYYSERKKELEDRYLQAKNDCEISEKKIEKKISEQEYRIKAARTYEAETKYRQAKQKFELELKALKEKNEGEIKLNFFKTQKRIEDEKLKYDFEVRVSLLSAIAFQYDVDKIVLESSMSKETCNVVYNNLSGKVQEYMCPICNKNSQTILVSIHGNFCCPDCSTYHQTSKGYLCKKDNVVKCSISGQFIPKSEEYLCYSCERYFEKNYLQVDALRKRVCVSCVQTTHNGEKINKKDALFSKKYDTYYKPSEVKWCSYSNDYYPIKDIGITTGSKKQVAKQFIKECKIAGLTFVVDEMDSKGISKFAINLKEIETKNIKYKKLKESIQKDKVEYNENKYWAIAKFRKYISSKYLLYDKLKDKVIDT